MLITFLWAGGQSLLKLGFLVSGSPHFGYSIKLKALFTLTYRENKISHV